MLAPDPGSCGKNILRISMKERLPAVDSKRKNISLIPNLER